MIKDFKKAHNSLDYVMNLIQFSMDGPNTNWAFHQAVSDLRKSENPVVQISWKLEVVSFVKFMVRLVLVWGRLIGKWERSSMLHGPFSRSLLPEDQTIYL